MADSAAKRIREAKKRRRREMKAERKRLRKEGLLGKDSSGLFLPGEPPRPIVDDNAAPPPAEEQAPETPESPETPEPPKQP